MDLKELIENGEVFKEPIVELCKLFTKEVMVKNKPQIIEKGPCRKIDGTECSAYIKPAIKWKLGNCPLATHIIYEEDEQKLKNPLKASKQGSNK